MSQAGVKWAGWRVFADKRRSPCVLREARGGRPCAPAGTPLDLWPSCDGSVKRGTGCRQSRCAVLRRRRSPAISATSLSMGCAPWLWRSRARRFGPITRTAFAPRASCGSCFARSGVGRRRGRSRARRSRRLCTASDPVDARRVGQPVGEDRREHAHRGEVEHLARGRERLRQHEQREGHRRDALWSEPGHERLHRR